MEVSEGGECLVEGDDDLTMETEEYLMIGQQQCQEALVSQGLKTAALTSQDN